VSKSKTIQQLFAKLEWDLGATIGIPVHIDSEGRILKRLSVDYLMLN
jgi:hypothetical protein